MIFINIYKSVKNSQCVTQAIVLFIYLFISLLAPKALAIDFPIQIEHRYGVADIPKQPQRVVSIGYTSHDFILALGVKPIALRRWYGNHPRGVWPWAEEALGDAEPVVMWGSINIEQIAALKPDLIVATMSGLSRDEYDFLSRIAPTLLGPKGYGGFNTPWQAQTRMLGKALGREEKAAEIIDDFNQRVSAIRLAHPQWQGLSAAICWAGGSIVYASFDPRARLIESLGFKTPAFIDALVNEESEFYATISDELLPELDTDVLLWLDSGDNRKHLRQLLLRPTLNAWKEGREVYLDASLSAAFSHASPLSMHHALDQLVPLLEQAADGDVSTSVISMVEAGLLPELPANKIKADQLQGHSSWF
jgi:iron complex transport system substrate-binding protein